MKSVTEIYETITSLEKGKSNFSFDLYKNIANIIWKYTEKSRPQMQENNTDERTQNIIYIGEKIYSEAIEEEDIIKILIAYCIFDFCNYEKDYFRINENKNLVEKIKKIYNSFNLNINVPNDAPYNEKKLCEILSDAEKNKNIKQRFEIMETLRNHSSTFDRIDRSMILFIQLLWKYNRNCILENIETKDTVTIELILYALEDSIEDFVKIELSGFYIRLRIASLLAYHIQSKYIQRGSEDFSKLPDYSDYYLNLFFNYKTEILENLPCLHFIHLTVFSYLFGICCAKEITLADMYISFANFTFHETTRAFSLGFMSSNSKKENLLLIGEKLLKKIKESEIKSFTDFNSYFGIFDILINYFFSIGLSKEEYINRIKESSDEIYLLQNSWDYSNLTCNWFSLWFLIISNKIYNYCFNEEKIIEAAPVLFDKRNWIALGDKENVFVNMINILKSPETEDGLLVLLNNKEVRLSLNNGE